MAKNSNAGATTLLVLALVFPLGAASFLLNLLMTVLYLPSIAPSISTAASNAIQIFLPFTLYVVGLVFSIVLLSTKAKETTLNITALVLNAIYVVSGCFFIYQAYFATVA